MVLDINSLAVPIFIYSFNVLNWNMCEIRKIDRKSRKLLTYNKMYYPKADTHRLYLPRFQGLIQLEISYKTTTIELAKPLGISNERMLKTVENYVRHTKLHSVMKQCKTFSSEFMQVEIQLQRKLNK